jgi:hypothetical protein
VGAAPGAGSKRAPKRNVTVNFLRKMQIIDGGRGRRRSLLPRAPNCLATPLHFAMALSDSDSREHRVNTKPPRKKAKI